MYTSLGNIKYVIFLVLHRLLSSGCSGKNFTALNPAMGVQGVGDIWRGLVEISIDTQIMNWPAGGRKVVDIARKNIVVDCLSYRLLRNWALARDRCSVPLRAGDPGSGL